MHTSNVHHIDKSVGKKPNNNNKCTLAGLIVNGLSAFKNRLIYRGAHINFKKVIFQWKRFTLYNVVYAHVIGKLLFQFIDHIAISILYSYDYLFVLIAYTNQMCVCPANALTSSISIDQIVNSKVMFNYMIIIIIISAVLHCSVFGIFM